VFGECRQRFDFFGARDRARQKGRDGKGGGWIAKFHACYWCYNPQSICSRAGSSGPRRGSCAYGDIVLPLCYGLFHGAWGAVWLGKRFGRSFADLDAFLQWCGEATTFGGGKAIQGVCVAAEALAEFRLF